MTVGVDRETVYEPEALVQCGAYIDEDAIEIADPIVVVEILSPSTRSIDSGEKRTGYFRIPSLRHDLIVDAVKRLIIHHRRGGDLIETRIVAEGMLRLDPPGLDLALANLFQGRHPA